MKSLVLGISLILAAAVAGASCPDNAPRFKWNTHSGDSELTADYMQDLMGGKSVRFGSVGMEKYRKNGKYSYSADGQTWRADSYRFYDGGVRCIAYPSVRFDKYVVNNGRLILINRQGGRYEAAVR